MDPSWTVDELAHAGPEHLDPVFVATYDQKSGTEPTEDIAWLRRYGLNAASTLVDLGAGTGTFALAVAPLCRRVVAVDVSSAMLELVHRRAGEAGLNNIECVSAGFLSYEHQGPAADFVCTRNALHHLPDFFKAIALERIARMLRPRGVLFLRDLIYDFQPSEAGEMLDQWFAGAVDDPARGYTRQDFAEHVRAEFSTYRWLFEPMLAAAGFEILEVEFARAVYGAYTCMKR
jgi:ubiquinone/menaquinone biosynthesis C-methylase UbiE